MDAMALALTLVQCLLGALLLPQASGPAEPLAQQESAVARLASSPAVVGTGGQRGTRGKQANRLDAGVLPRKDRGTQKALCVPLLPLFRSGCPQLRLRAGSNPGPRPQKHRRTVAEAGDA